MTELKQVYKCDVCGNLSCCLDFLLEKKIDRQMEYAERGRRSVPFSFIY